MDKVRNLAKCPWYPIGIGCYFVAHLYAENLDQLTVSNVLPPAGLVLGVILGTVGLMRLLMGDWFRPAQIVAIWSILFFTYGYAYLGLLPLTGHVVIAALAHHSTLFTIWVVIGLGASVLTFTRRWIWQCPTANLIAFGLLLFPTATVAGSIFHPREVEAAVLLESSAVLHPKDRPDIYYVILDGYGRGDLLQRYYGFDNSAFLAQLRRRGFWIPDKSSSNYMNTAFSLASSLNFDYLDQLKPASTPLDLEHWLSSGTLRSLIARSRAFAELRRRGYSVVNVSSGVSLTNTMVSADVNYGFESNLAEFNSVLLSTTMLLPFLSQQFEMLTGDDLLKKLANLGRAASLRGPKMVFAHILSPHPPYQFDSKGNAAPSAPPGVIMNWANRAAYVEQMRFLNDRILVILDTIVASSKERPIVILQGDHGPSLLDHSVSRPWNQVWTTDLLTARAGILNAFLVPDRVRSCLYPTITPVNTFRTILRSQFDDPIKNLRDKSFYSTMDRSTRFLPVPPMALAKQPASPRTP